MSAVSAADSPVFRFNEFVLDVAHRSLRRADREVELRPRSFEVLAYLVGAAGRAVGKDELLQAVWPGVVVTEDSLTRCISDIRQALGDEGQRVIKTLPRRGYVFVATLANAQPAGGPATQSVAARGARRWPWVLGAAAALALLMGLAAWRWGGPDSPAPRLSISCCR
ncbi:MAG: transcriptional regulator [Burkholderiaceae bacterium]|nr:MAG: transcriptional regulator [Burkholderiaceae bacterium]